ncbi:MAG TPA: hypothetical protein VMZ52_13325 [Bryobacteraceae bacterium]|nr:hypothetical protein [Bryobacteraceae bacterium]
MRSMISAGIALLASAPLIAFGQADVTLSNQDRIVVHSALTSSHAHSNHGHYDRSYHQHYFFTGTAGDSIWITTVSTAGPQMLPVAVALYAPQGSNFVADDGGSLVDPRRDGQRFWYASIGRQLPVSGRYLICLHSHSDGVRGSFALTVSTHKGAGGRQTERGLSPEFRSAAADTYRKYYSVERSRYCTQIPQQQLEEAHTTRRAAASLRRTEADSALMSLMNGYTIATNIWHAAQMVYPTPDCTRPPEYEEFFRTCREAIEIALNGGSIAARAVCQKSG